MMDAASKQRVGARRLSLSARYSLALLTAAVYVAIQLIQAAEQGDPTRELLTWASGLFVAAGLFPVRRLWAQLRPNSFRFNPKSEPLRPIQSPSESLRPIQSPSESLRPIESLSALLRPMQRPMPPDPPRPWKGSLQQPESPASGPEHEPVQTAAASWSSMNPEG